MNLNNISILENSLYTTPTEREELVNDKEQVAKLFVTTFLGFIAMYGSGKVKSSLATYLRDEQKVTLRNIGDDNNDLSLVIKLALESGVIRIQQAREMTKLVYLLKKLSIDTVDEVAILNLMSPNIKLIKELDGRFKSQYNRYLSSEISIYEFIYNLRTQIRADESLSTEFKDIFIKYLPMLKKKAGVTDDTDDTDSPIVTQTDATNLAKSPTPEDIEATQAAEDKVKDTAVADDYDLTNHDTLQKIFINAVSGDAKSVLKSVGTTLGKFPWADVAISDDVAYAWYKNRSTTSIKDNYINRLRVSPYGRAKFSRNTLPARLTGDSLYLRGLEVALNRGLDVFKFFEETIQLWQTNHEAFDGLRHSFQAIQKKLGNKSYNFFLKVLDEGYGNIKDLSVSTLYMLFSDPTERYGLSEAEVIKYFIDNFDTFNTKEKETIVKLIIISNAGYRAWNFDDRFDERKRTYDNISASRESIAEEFGLGWMKFYAKLEENDFYNSDFIRSFEITTLKDLDPDTDPKNIYEYYKGQQIQLVSEENFSKLMQYVKSNNLETDWLKSLSSWNEIDNLVISNSPNSQNLDLETLFSLVPSARQLTTKEYEFIIRAIATYVVEKNKSNIFKPHTISEFETITGNIANMFGHSVPNNIFRIGFDRMLSIKGVAIITDIFSKYEPMQVLIDINDTYAEAFSYLVGERRSFGSTVGFNFTTELSPNTNINSIIRGIVSVGIEPVVYGTTGLSYSITKDITHLKDMGRYVRADSSVLDNVLGSNSKEKIISGVLKEFIKISDSTKISYRGLSHKALVELADHLPRSYNDLLKEFIEVLDELEVAAAIAGTVNTSKEVLTMLVTRGIVDIGTIDITEVNKLITPDNLRSEIGGKIVDRGLELQGDEFITSTVAKFEISSTNTSTFYDAVRESNPESLGVLEDALINSSSYAFIAGFSDTDNYASFKDGFVKKIVETANPEFKEKFAKESLKRMTHLSPKKLASVIKNSKDIVVTLLFNINDESFDEIIESDIPAARKRELGTIYITRKMMKQVDFKADLFDSKQPIVPMTDLSDERLVQILEYNDIKIETKGTRKRKNETYSEYLNRVADESIESFILGDVKATDEELSQDMMNRRTVEYNKLHSNNKHGDVALKFVRTLSASPELTRDTFQKFKDEHPGTGMIPVFHGTGSVAASMIMRKGFAVIDASDASATGRMLGNGIYFSDILDKAAQYVGDAGFGRSKGTRGYLLEMQATLGKEKIDYDAAGITGNDRIVSPEWVVYDPGNQLSIKKAHEVILVSKSEIEKLAEMNDLSEEYKSDFIVPIKGFTNWIKPIKESFNVDLNKYSCTFVFRDGTIPLGGIATSWRDINLPDNVHMESSALGTAITIYFDNPDIPLEDVYIVTNTREFIQEDGEVYKILTSIMDNDPLTY